MTDSERILAELAVLRDLTQRQAEELIRTRATLDAFLGLYLGQLRSQGVDVEPLMAELWQVEAEDLKDKLQQFRSQPPA